MLLKTSVIILGVAGTAFAGGVPLPSAELVPRTVNSIPWLAADRQLVPVDLKQFGYREEEYFLGGSANVYTWDKAGAAVVRTPNAHYVNRIIVRKPADVQRFSGNVIVEVLNTTFGWEVAPLWALMTEKILQEGDVYVGVSSRPISVEHLKRYDPVRYGRLSWANPLPAARRNPNPPVFITPSRSETEDGLVWDIFSQVGALLKSGESSNPLYGYKVEKVYAVGASQSAMVLHTYINAIHAHATTVGGKPVYDGFLVTVGSAVRPINQDSPAISYDDPRQIIGNCGVPVIRIMSQLDFHHKILGSVITRRSDSDATNDRFRHYEVAGISHAALHSTFYRPGSEEMAGIGKTADLAATNISTFPIQFLVNGAMRNLDRWVRQGVAPPKADRFAEEDGKLVLDAHGNGLGGVRTPFVDVPIGTYDTTKIYAVFVPFSQERLKELYPTHRDYVEKVAAMADKMVRERWISPFDGERIKYEAIIARVPE